MKFISPARCQNSSGKSKTLLVLALLASISSLSLHSRDINQVQAIQISSEGIFDRLEKKMGEKERAQVEMQQQQQLNLVRAQRQAALIASTEAGPSPEEEMEQTINQLDQTPIKKLAGMRVQKNRASSSNVLAASSLVQKAPGNKGVQKPVEDDEPRDDFEGFGSITAMVQNKDKLVEKTLADEEFQADIQRKEQEEQQAKEKAKRDKEAAEKAAQQAKAAAKEAEKHQKEQKNKKSKISSMKAKLAAALDKASHKNTAAPKVAAVQTSFKKKPAAIPTGPVSLVSQNAYQKAIDSVIKKPKISVTQPTHVEPAVISTLHQMKESDEEPSGFLGKFSKKISDQEENSARIQEQQEADQLFKKTPQIKYSKSAPKHKGMLARAFEKDVQEQEKKEEQEKDALMQAALNDPTFQNNLNSLKGQNALSGLI